jgi:hypothetical protein
LRRPISGFTLIRTGRPNAALCERIRVARDESGKRHHYER